jgi:hypothetical protein
VEIPDVITERDARHAFKGPGGKRLLDIDVSLVGSQSIAPT